MEDYVRMMGEISMQGHAERGQSSETDFYRRRKEVVGHSKKVEATTTSFVVAFGVGFGCFFLLKIKAF